MTQLLMPKATAVWLIDNTALSFDQIADFCSLHPLEVLPAQRLDRRGAPVHPLRFRLVCP